MHIPKPAGTILGLRRWSPPLSGPSRGCWCCF